MWPGIATWNWSILHVPRGDTDSSWVMKPYENCFTQKSSKSVCSTHKAASMGFPRISSYGLNMHSCPSHGPHTLVLVYSVAFSVNLLQSQGVCACFVLWPLSVIAHSPNLVPIVSLMYVQFSNLPIPMLSFGTWYSTTYPLVRVCMTRSMPTSWNMNTRNLSMIWEKILPMWHIADMPMRHIADMVCLHASQSHTCNRLRVSIPKIPFSV